MTRPARFSMTLLKRAGSFVQDGAGMNHRKSRVLIALALGLGAPVHAVAADPRPQAPWPDPAQRRAHDEFERQARPFRAAFDALQARKPTLSPEELKDEAAALVPRLAALEPAASAPLSRLVYGTWQKDLGTMAGDAALVAHGLQAMLDSGALQSNLVPATTAMLGQIAYLAKDYPTAIRVLSPQLGNAQVADAVPEMVADARAAQGNPVAGLEALNTAITARQAAGAMVPEAWYARGAAIAYGAHLLREAADWSARQLAADPAPLNWLRAVQTARAAQSPSSAADALEWGRLLDRSGALKTPARYLASEYAAYLQVSDGREARHMAEQAIADGVLKPDDPAVKTVLDKPPPPAIATKLTADPTGKAALAAADLALSNGDAAQAEQLCTMALAKAGGDADLDRLLALLGMAQLDQGKIAEARATFARISAQREGVTRLWLILADQRAAKQPIR